MCVVEGDEGQKGGGLFPCSQHIYNFNWPITYITLYIYVQAFLFYMYIFHCSSTARIPIKSLMYDYHLCGF